MSVNRLNRRAARGRTDETPLLVLSGVTITIALVVAVVLLVSFLAYYFG